MGDANIDREAVLKEILDLLKCVACDQLPARELWLIGGSCAHKYCEKCILAIRSKPCMKCTEPGTGNTHNPYIDPITTELLSNLKQLKACLDSGDSCRNCKKTALDEYEFEGTPEVNKNEEDKSHQNKAKISKNGYKSSTLGSINSAKPSTDERTGSKKSERTERKSKGLADDGPPETEGTSKLELLTKTSRIKVVKYEDTPTSTNPLSRNRLRKSGSKSSHSAENPSSRSVSDHSKVAKLDQFKGGSAEVKAVKPSPSIYDLDESQILEMEEETIRKGTKLRLDRNKDKRSGERAAQKEKIDNEGEMKSPDSPPASLPDLTQHGNIPTKEDLSVDVEVPGMTKRSSPTLPVLSPVTGRAFPTTEPKREDDTDQSTKRQSKSDMSGKRELHLLPKTPCIESPKNNFGRGKRKDSRSPSVSSNVSSNSDLKSNASTVESPLSEKCNAKGETKLHVACRIGQIEKVKQLLDAGVDINACDFAGWTPLHEAINSNSNNSFEIVDLLCQAGCNVNTPGLDNDTPLHECVRTGRIRTIKFLLSYGASTSFRNKAGRLPREVTVNETIQKILDEFNGPYIREPDESEVIEAFMKNSVTYFTYKEDENVLAAFKTGLNGRVVESFGNGVTHVIFDQKSIQHGKVPFSLHYLTSVLSGAWLLSSKWVQDSVLAGKFMDPRNYEISGCLTESKSSTDSGLANDAPSRARKNKEMGRPGLFDGFNVYLYKTCGYEDLKKKDLSQLITVGGGKVVNREPTPESVDPLDYPVRFHAQEPDHKMTITSHIILYDVANKPANLYSMEHLKSLRTDWLIESALCFKILDPEQFSIGLSE